MPNLATTHHMSSNMSSNINDANAIELFILALLKDDHGITSEAYMHLVYLFHGIPRLEYIWGNVEAVDDRFFLPDV